MREGIRKMQRRKEGLSIFVREVCKRGEREKRKCNQATAIEKEVPS